MCKNTVTSYQHCSKSISIVKNRSNINGTNISSYLLAHISDYYVSFHHMNVIIVLSSRSVYWVYRVFEKNIVQGQCAVVRSELKLIATWNLHYFQRWLLNAVCLSQVWCCNPKILLFSQEKPKYQLCHFFAEYDTKLVWTLTDFTCLSINPIVLFCLIQRNVAQLVSWRLWKKNAVSPDCSIQIG